MAGMKRFSVWILVLLGVVLSMTAACRRISFIEDSGAKLTFNRDTVKFDTVFTVGSATAAPSRSTIPTTRISASLPSN